MRLQLAIPGLVLSSAALIVAACSGASDNSIDVASADNGGNDIPSVTTEQVQAGLALFGGGPGDIFDVNMCNPIPYNVDAGAMRTDGQIRLNQLKAHFGGVLKPMAHGNYPNGLHGAAVAYVAGSADAWINYNPSPTATAVALMGEEEQPVVFALATAMASVTPVVTATAAPAQNARAKITYKIGKYYYQSIFSNAGANSAANGKGNYGQPGYPNDVDFANMQAAVLQNVIDAGYSCD